MSKLEEIAALLDVEIGEEFQITNDVYTYRITEQEMERKIGGEWIGIAGSALYDVLRGKKHIVKKPWKPQNGDKYWRVIANGDCRDVEVNSLSWNGCMFDLAYYAIGNCFHTKEEAEKHKDEVLAKLKGVYDEGKPLIEVDKEGKS